MRWIACKEVQIAESQRFLFSQGGDKAAPRRAEAKLSRATGAAKDTQGQKNPQTLSDQW